VRFGAGDNMAEDAGPVGTSQLKRDDTRAANWKLNMVSTGPVAAR
jgi:hypothetical protein